MTEILHAHVNSAKAFYAFGFLALTLIVVALTTVSILSLGKESASADGAFAGDCHHSHDM